VVAATGVAPDSGNPRAHHRQNRVREGHLALRAHCIDFATYFWIRHWAWT
jgi:hypothetical protein